MILCCAMRGRTPDASRKYEQRLEIGRNDMKNTITSVCKDNLMNTVITLTNKDNLVFELW